MEEDHGDKTSEEISAVQYVVLQLIIKKSEIEKNKKNRSALQHSPNRKYIFTQGKKTGVQFHASPKRKP